MIKLCIAVLLSLYCNAVAAQFEKNYTSIPVQDTIPPEIFQKIKFRLDRDKASIGENKGNISEYIRDIYEKRSDFLVENFNSDYFITDSVLSSYLQSVLKNIYTRNPNLPQETSVYTYRSESPNAVSFGEGTIAFTIGLLSRMENEAQIAFILCHEMAHYHARHSDIKALELARLNYDKGVRKKLKDISRNEYGKFTQYNELMGTLGLSITKHSREKEFEADSLALLFYLNTSYDPKEAVRTLEILDKADSSPYFQNLDLKKHFNFKDYPFKEGWKEYSRSTTWHVRREENDSTSTHPACKKRIEAIERQLQCYKPHLPVSNKTQVNFDHIKVLCHFEIIASHYHFKSYGIALFKAMILIEKYPDNVYLHSVIGKCLYQLYWHQKNHELGKVLYLPDPRFEENYDRFLTFVHKLRLMELASLTYYYASTKKEMYYSDEEFIYTYWLASQTEVSKDDPAVIKGHYLSKFPSGKYNRVMN